MRIGFMVQLLCGVLLFSSGLRAEVLFSDQFNGTMEDANNTVGWENGVQKWSEIKPAGWGFLEAYGRWRSWGFSGASSAGPVAGLVSLPTFTLSSSPITIDTRMWRESTNQSVGGDVLLVLMQSNTAISSGDLYCRIDRWSQIPRLQVRDGNQLWGGEAGVNGGIVRFVVEIDATEYALYTNDIYDEDEDEDTNELVLQSSGTHSLGFSTFYVGTVQEQTGYNPAAANWDYVTVGQVTCSQIISQGDGYLGDLNYDCHVDLNDLAVMAEQWMSCYDPQNSQCD